MALPHNRRVLVGEIGTSLGNARYLGWATLGGETLTEKGLCADKDLKMAY